MSRRTPSLFISYRRADTQSVARQLHSYFAARFGSHRVFMDRVEIRGGDDLNTRIDRALKDATIVIAVIGPDWLTLRGEGRVPRLQLEDDWVRRELRTALRERKKLIPLYVDDALPIQDKRRLPADLSRLARIRGVKLEHDHWEDGLEKLANLLERGGFRSARKKTPMPEPRKTVKPFSPATLERHLKKLPGWSLTSSDIATENGPSDRMRNEIYKEYTFRSFPDATRFMAQISPEIDKGQHHPRWENIWSTVRVWLCTWDIEFQPSPYDIRLAEFLDSAYSQFYSTSGKRKGASA
jgi:pterin-4a-carbinolamine dehydratase